MSKKCAKDRKILKLDKKCEFEDSLMICYIVNSYILSVPCREE